jgi:hypothetical protein
LEGESKAGAVGFGKGYADVTLTESDGQTVLNYTANFQVGGRLAQLGSRLVVVATRKIADDFFANLVADIDESATRVVPEAPSRPWHHFWVEVTVIVAMVVWLIWWLAGPGTAQ